MAADQGCVGYCTSNMASAVVLAHGSRQAATGNNPLAWAFPTKDERPVVLDMACGVAALGKIALLALDGRELPHGVAADAEGRPTRDPAQACLYFPAGGAKGYALALVHDILSGGLSAGGMTMDKPHWEPGEPYQGTLFFLAIDIAAILPLDEFVEAMDAQVRAVNALPPAEGFERVYMPGQIEWESFAEREASGIPFPPGALETLQPLSERLGVAWPWSEA
jgi:ureidoglycolate dehydrogenase (NAD+)